jgi:hypothetical protein
MTRKRFFEKDKQKLRYPVLLVLHHGPRAYFQLVQILRETEQSLLDFFAGLLVPDILGRDDRLPDG